jgi:C4-dicarboxylate-binding protein DctP
MKKMVILLMTVLSIASVSAQVIEIKLPSISVQYTKMGSNEIMNFNYAAQLAFKNYVESNSAGRMTVTLYTNGQLGNGPEILQQCMQQVIYATTTGEADLSSYYPQLQIFSIPYCFKNRAEFYAMLDSPFMKEMNDDIATKTNIRIISAFDNGGFRNFSNSIRPIHSAADLKGLKIRCMEIPAHLETVKSFGSLPTPIPYTELYNALQTGVVDGQENSPMVMMDGSVYEVQKYYTLDGHMISPAYIAVNESWLKSLPADLQRIVLDGGKIAEYAARGAINSGESLALNIIRESGVEIYSPSDTEKKTFEIAREPVVNWIKGQIAPEFVDQFLYEVSLIQVGEELTVIQRSEAQQSGTLQSNNAVFYIIIVLLSLALVVTVVFAVKRKSK